MVEKNISKSLSTFCKKCGKELTGKISLERGYDPECWNKLQKEKEMYLNIDSIFFGDSLMKN
jgi:hypothetical protein